MIPIVAVVGRPNVGKSTLFNRWAGKPLAIVFDAPGVTRDRHYASAFVQGREITLVDTGGFDPDSDDPMGHGIVRQVALAVSEADVVVCVFDGLNPPTGADRHAVALLRRSEKPVIYVANKIDNPERGLEAAELYELGVAPILPLSALHGAGTAAAEAALAAVLPSPVAESEAPKGAGPRVALVGKPNAGKSSLFNRLIGSDRSLVDERPGTTRDPIDAAIEFEGRPLVIVDTAGIRRRPKVEAGVEGASVLRALRALGRADVTILMVDATEGVSEQDARLLGLASERRRALLVALNKLDLLNGAARKRCLSDARRRLHFAPWAPILGVSAKTGFGVSELVLRAARAADDFGKRVATGELNRFFDEVLARQPPPTAGGKAPRLYYVTQAEVRPPVFVVMTSAPEAIRESYRRFIANQIRKRFGFEAVPLTVRFRKRSRRT